MKQLATIANPTFDLPDCTPGALDYMAQAYTEEMHAFVHLFRQQSPLFGLPETYALNSFYLKAPKKKDRFCQTVLIRTDRDFPDLWIMLPNWAASLINLLA